jgi:hypothetical protein
MFPVRAIQAPLISVGVPERRHFHGRGRSPVQRTIASFGDPTFGIEEKIARLGTTGTSTRALLLVPNEKMGRKNMFLPFEDSLFFK